MRYETIATISQVLSLLMFIAMFAAVLVYALWPANRASFDSVQRQALDLGDRGQAEGAAPHAAMRKDGTT